MIRALWIAGVFLLSSAVARGEDPPAKTGSFEQTDAATSVKIAYHVPEQKEAKEPLFIMVAHHGVGKAGGAGMRDFMLKFLKDQPWILICPTNDGLTRGNAGATVRDADKVADASKNAVEFVRKTYNADKKRVLAMGYSGGGHSTVKCFNKYPDLFTSLWLASCNFSAPGGGDKDRTVLITYGEKDLDNIIRDVGRYESGLKGAGYGSIRKLKVPNGHHIVNQPAIDEFLAWWSGDVLKEKKK